MNGYIIELEGERGTHHTVKKVFTTIAKAEEYLKKCDYINHQLHAPLEKVVSRSISKVEIV